MENKKKKIDWKPFWEMVRFIFIILIIVIPFRIFIAQPFIVSGSSMFPTFHNGEYLIVDEISYRFKEPKRDDVVVFKYPNDTKKFFIKRIIGLPGETININGSDVTIINDSHSAGLKLEEPYVENKSSNEMSLKLEKDEYFVMGDNRSGSSDSRFWGPVKKDLLIGRAFLRLFPFKETFGLANRSTAVTPPVHPEVRRQDVGCFTS
jgi:signal peptidase I